MKGCLPLPPPKTAPRPPFLRFLRVWLPGCSAGACAVRPFEDAPKQRVVTRTQDLAVVGAGGRQGFPALRLIQRVVIHQCDQRFDPGIERRRVVDGQHAARTAAHFREGRRDRSRLAARR